jgi:tight adherence protein B
MSNVILWLFAVSCLSLLGLWISGYFVAKGQQQQEKRKNRLRQVSQPKALQRQAMMSAFVPTGRGQRRSPMAICANLVGAEPSRLSQYPVPWWVVIAVAIGVAKVAQVLGSEMLGTASWALVLPVWLIMTRYIFGWMEKRRKHRAVLQLPDILDQVVRGTRVGMPVLEAIRAATRDALEPTKGEFTRLIDQVSIGTPLEDAVADMARRCALPEYSFLATALSLQNQTGGALSETLSGLSEVVRKRVAIIEKGKALSSEAKATAVVLTVLPFATGVIMWVMNPDYMSLLFTDPMGHKMLGGAGVSLLLGLLTIRQMFQKALSLT